MIRFLKTPDRHNKHDITEVQIICPNAATITDLIDVFSDFLVAIGFSQETVDVYLGESDE